MFQILLIFLEYFHFFTTINFFTHLFSPFFHSLLWLPDGIPPDGFPREEIVTVHLSVTVIFVILASVGVVFTIACLIYNFLFRKKKCVP